MSRKRQSDSLVHGILNVNKPSGLTSFDAVAFVRKRSGTRRVGHGGTLDPAATGVLPIGVGRATRFLEYLLLGRKEYEATLLLGVSTDTYDAEGTVTRTCNPQGIGLDDIQAVLQRFVGEILQVPPIYSALKHQGTRLYEYARAGIDVPREPRIVSVYKIDISSFDSPRLRLTIECGRGTYIRSIASDLGEALGCGAHLESLTRTRVGPFRLRDSVDLASLPALVSSQDWDDYLNAPDTALEHEGAAIVDDEHALALRQGKMIQLNPDIGAYQHDLSSISRAYSVDGRFVAVIRFDDSADAWRPEKVLQTESGVSYA
jgi:tRNA pseudouridine55 synthase